MAAVALAADFPCLLPPAAIALAAALPNAAACAAANRLPLTSAISIAAVAPDASDTLAAAYHVHNSTASTVPDTNALACFRP